VFSYAEVVVSSKTLKWSPKDGSGAPVKEADGKPCGPFTVTAK
jgi:hypothetical protein